jgi:hypothetical protein
MNRRHLVAAEAQFKAKAESNAGTPLASAEYESAQAATREKTARLRALRLAKEAEEGLRKPPAKRFPNRRRAARIFVTPADPQRT